MKRALAACVLVLATSSCTARQATDAAEVAADVGCIVLHAELPDDKIVEKCPMIVERFFYLIHPTAENARTAGRARAASCREVVQ